MTVLLLGSTGNVGPHTVESLLEAGSDVRVLARDAARARGILPASVTVIEGDPATDADLLAAADGATAVLLLSGHGFTMAETQLRVIRALRREPIRIVKLSATSSAIRHDGPHVARQHWEVEEVLKGGDNPFVILRPNTFMQVGIGWLMGAAAQSGDAVPNPIGTAGVSMVDARDVGTVAARALAADSWDGETLVLTGPEAVTYPQIAEQIAAVTGTELRLFDMTPAGVQAALIGRGVEPWEAEHFAEMYQLIRDGESAFVTDDILRVTNRASSTVASYIVESAAAGLFTRKH
ncbi:NAD(P)H-binding protein [Salinibacterium sp.]|uniref:NAD(P)H-binding protein n=1 Tax=Salinibacterium sp. TaxID=1915057 RepID=UPI00286AF689|nr:NAD(P)H-binding protein [Salinibacterium sp.]